MAFRRRSFGGRRFGRPKQPVRYAWVNTLFNETALAADATTFGSQSILDEADWLGDVTASLVRSAYVRRIIVNSVVNLTPQSTTFTQDTTTGIWALLLGNEDQFAATTSINSTNVDSLLNTTRILQSGLFGGRMLEIPSAVQAVSQYQPYGMINIDYKVRLKMRPESQIILAVQLQSDASSVVSVASFSTFSRVLLEQN